jgi:hypothetical protein
MRRKGGRKEMDESRRAYRMAILASLAYHDFRNDDIRVDEPRHGNSTTMRGDGGGGGGGGGWASFALADDIPPPSNYITTMGSNDAKKSSSSIREKKKKNTRVDRMRRTSSGIVDRFHVTLCRAEHGFRLLATGKTPSSSSTLASFLRPARNDAAATSTTKDKCKRGVMRRREGGKRYVVEYVLSDFHEERVNIRWHDTDLIIATSGMSDVVIAFAGTAGPADAVTNIQTFEPASHSGLFDKWRGGGMADDDATNSTSDTIPKSSSSSVEGNIHRGYLNAYARVVRGKILRIDGGGHQPAASSNFLMTLDGYYDECIAMQGRTNATIDREDDVAIAAKGPAKSKHDGKKRIKKGRRRGREGTCRSSRYRLMDILRNVTTSALRSGRNVHLVGHSLAGALATIHAIDVTMNYDRGTAPIQRLHLWTFGAPEVADSLFFESAGSTSRRLRDFLGDTRRHHRYVTRSTKNCDTDVIASIASNALNRGRAVRRLGGVRGDVVHINEPTYLPGNATGVELHELKTYLRGISSSSPSSRGLRTDFPSHVRSWLGEDTYADEN